MNPSTGRFISMDCYTGSIYDPASLHRYTYVKDNPVMYKDPSGYKPDSLTGTSVALGIREVLSHVVELNCIGILNSIINATAATLMGGTEEAAFCNCKYESFRVIYSEASDTRT